MATLIHKSKSRTSELWQGGLRDLIHPEKYDVIVLCADEIQSDPESRRAYGSTRIIDAPNDDSGNVFTKEQATIAVNASKEVVEEYRQGKRILVSCAMGRNRSGLVMALTLHRLFGVSGNEAIRVIQAKIPDALFNVEFKKFLRTIP